MSENPMDLMMRVLPKELTDRFDPSLVSEMRDFCNEPITKKQFEDQYNEPQKGKRI